MTNTETWTGTYTFTEENKTTERDVKVTATFPEGTPMVDIIDDMIDTATTKAARLFRCSDSRVELHEHDETCVA